jgi:hypothetical protein
MLSIMEAVMRPPMQKRAAKRRRLPSRDDVDAITTSVILPRRLHRRAMSAAGNLNWTFSEVIRRALGDWLKTAGRATR